ncbi:alpha/beta hydrolase [Neobacillus sp. MER 74]|uniref:alpha/beta fold hydrolase n=1 Tax=Bacillaceae TaxID=186817 RepID=UPI000BF31AFF|nr:MULTISPECIES: alpha/beta hydrolase [Bacillaceae]MCM3115659.1 alpha/beta hydrolase [Neobacillus sp. MER 74]PFP31144.1 alpha/beta hydrolase [Bacillus sp. AFS073361]
MELKKLKAKDSTSTVAYIDSGEGKPIVLLHGFCGSSSYWEFVIPTLSADYRVIAPDLPGHGQSEPLQGTSTIENMADQVKHLLDALNLPEVTMFGHSLGGYITLAFAEKYGGQLNGYSLIHSTAFPDSEEAKQARAANIEKVNRSGIYSLIDGLVPKLFSQENQDENFVGTAMEIGYATSAEGAIDALHAMKDRPDRNRVLESSTLPVLLVAGEQDQIIPAEKTFSVSRANIKQSIIKDSGHMSMFENPMELISEIQAFLATL